jgi:hypothetical protein
MRILSWRKLALAAAVTPAYAFIFRPWHLKWGTTGDETARHLPGDELVPDPSLNATHAVTIDAPPANVWPWLVQLGYGRGGFYSYDFLENLMGLNIHSADRVVAENQILRVGDMVPFAPTGEGAKVAVLENEKALALYTGMMDTTKFKTVEDGAPKPRLYFTGVWEFVLEPIDDGHTRLLERFRADWNPGIANTLIFRVILEPVSFIMERKMLLGIKKRAEQPARP